VEFVFSFLSVVCYLGLLLGVSNVVGAVWVFLVGFFVVYSLVCGSGVPFVGCDCIYSTKYHRQQPLYNTLELVMMGIVVPETC